MFLNWFLLVVAVFKQTLATSIVFQATTLFQNYIPFSSHFLFFPSQAAIFSAK